MPSEEKNNYDTNGKQLREKALQWLNGKPGFESMDPEDIRTLLHELDAHQAELKAQNEELRNSQAELAQMHEKYLDLYEYAPVGYLTLDIRGVIRQANHMAATIANLELGRIVGRRFESLLVEEDREASRRFMRNLLSMEALQSGEFRIQRKDGKTKWVREDVSLLSGTVWKESGYRVTLTDITQRKQVEEELEQAKENLEKRVEARTYELSKTVEQLEREVGLRTSAEQRLRHRTEQLESLAMELTKTEQRERRKLAQMLHDELQQMLVAAKLRVSLFARSLKDPSQLGSINETRDLIDESIQFSRDLVGTLSPPVLQQGGLVAALRWLAGMMEKKYGLHVSLDLDEAATPETEETSTLLFQTAKELLFNVTKHAKVKEAELSLKREKDKAVMTVSDQGLGFDPEKVRTGENPKSGTGFGLFSIRERLQFTKGKLEVESAPGEGSVFRVTSPIRCPIKEAQKKAKEEADKRVAEGYPPRKTVVTEPEGGDGVRVLLADDHTLMRQGLAQLLRETPGIQVIGEAPDGAVAVEMVRQLHPDVVTMDINMPNMNGIEATRIIHDEFPDVRIIGLSMFNEPEQAQAMKDAGAVRYLTKTGPSDELAESILAFGP